MKAKFLGITLMGVFCFGFMASPSRAGESVSIPQGTELIVSIRDQKMALLRDGVSFSIYPISTSRFGTGDRPGSYATPLGKLVVKTKIGRGCRLGTVFKGRSPTGEVIPPNAPGRDPIVSRILWLDGQENQNRHAFARCIYIHGTPQENLLGKPMSYGCIRMRSKDVANLADTLPIGTSVKITQEHLPKNHKSSRSGLLASLF